MYFVFTRMPCESYNRDTTGKIGFFVYHIKLKIQQLLLLLTAFVALFYTLTNMAFLKFRLCVCVCV